MKDSALISMTIRVEKDLKDWFMTVCEGQDETASRVLRQYMREYAVKHGQGSLLTVSRKKK